MDKYEFNIKVEQIKKLMKKKDFITAVKIADTIDWERVKENQLLIMAADVYEIAGRYDAARDVLLLAYEKTGLGRQLAYRLCRLSVKRGDISEAEEFYHEFTRNSPRDAGKYILQYEMSKGRGEAIEKQIEILETYIEEDMDERWAYELAKLYHKAHLRDKCVEQCDTIILWFADGKYVEKAMELKQLYVPLSENQRLKYEAQKSRRAEAKNDIVHIAPPAKEPESEAEALVSKEQAAEAIDKTMSEKAAANADKEADYNVQEEAIDEKAKSTYVEKQNGDILDEVHEADIDVNLIHVKDFSVNNKFDTVNLQRELAQSVRSLFDNTIEVFKPTVKKEEHREETAEDDQIEGQMSLEEVLAMFESGELQTRKEPAVEANIVEEEAVEEVNTVEEETVEAANTVNEEVAEVNTAEEKVIEENTVEELENIEDEKEGIVADEAYDMEDISDEQAEQQGNEESAENTKNADIEADNDLMYDDFDDTTSEEELLADIIAKEIQIDISEEIEEQIEDKAEEIEDYAEEIEEEETESFGKDICEEEILEAGNTEEEYSGEAESEIQESNPIMFDLKEGAAEAGNIEEAKEATGEQIKENTKTDTDDEAEETSGVYENDVENDVEDEPAAEERQEEKSASVVHGQIQSETAKEELKNFIGRFSGVQGLDKQILKVMQTTLKAEKAPVKFIFVKGEVKSGKTTLAIEVLKLANKIMQRRDQKIAKIKAESINGKSIDGLLSKLDGSDVLIERVSDMEPDTFVELIDKLNAEGRERFVIFEDEKSLADTFLDKVPESHRGFPNVLDIRQNKIKDWTKMASDYAKKQGYTFDEMGTLALSAKIDQLRAITLVVHKNHVEQLVDGAIKKSERFSLRKLLGRAKDESGLILLTEKDFID